MAEALIPTLAFLASGAVVVGAGTVLARRGDAIADATGIGRLWIGGVLVAAATSLPELVTGVSAVRMGAADLAVGNIFGSSMANMLILALLDWMARNGGNVRRRAAFEHALAATLAMVLNVLATLFVLIRPVVHVAGVSPASLVLIVGFLASTRAVYRDAVKERADLPKGMGPEARRRLVRRELPAFGGAALATFVSAPAFAWSAARIADLSGLGQTVVGTWLVGIATSLPELATSMAAMRMGAFDLAVANLFGSNSFNIALLLPLELAQPPGAPLFAGLDRGHAVSGLFGVILTGLGLASVIYRAERRIALAEPSSILMLVVYVVGLWVLYTIGAPL